MRVSMPLAAVLLVASCAVAVPANAEVKIGVFDKQQIVDQSKLGSEAKARFEVVQAEREQEVAGKQKLLEGLQKSYEQRAAVLSGEKRIEMQRELARARDEYQSAAQNADRDLQRAYQSALLEIVAKIDPVIRAFGKDGGYDFLFDVSQVAFNLPGHDVTADLIRRIDETPEG